MSNLNPFYISYGTGSLSGFTSFTREDGTIDPVLTGWSVDQLMAYLKNPDNIPPREWIIEVENDLSDHLNDTNNPHNTTVEQLANNFVEQILTSLVPGTVPDVGPFYSFKANLDLPMGDLFPSTVTASNIYRLSNNGYFKVVEQEAEYIGTDYSPGIGGIPLYKSFTDLVQLGWDTDSSTPINTLVQLNTLPHDYSPTAFFRISETSTTGDFGVNVVAPLSDLTSYTLEVFVKTAGIEGTLKINQTDDPSKFALVSVDTGECVASHSSIQVFTTSYPNGVIKISFCFTTVADTQGSVSFRFYEKNGTITSRVGVYGRTIFNINRPMISQTPPRAPRSVLNTDPVVSEQFSLTLNRFINSSTIGRFTVSIEVLTESLTVPVLGTNTNVLSMGTFQISRDATSFYVKSNNTVIYSAPIISGLNRISVSYTTENIVVKFMTNDSVKVSGIFPSIDVSNWFCGPFGGYLTSLEIYATDENNDLLGFLNNA